LGQPESLDNSERFFEICHFVHSVDGHNRLGGSVRDTS
jgi:hypothetical protein